MENTKKTSHLEARSTIFFIFLMFTMALIIIPTASAFEFDNKKSYDSETKTVTIKNSVLGIIPTNEVAKATLKTQEDMWIKVEEGVNEYLVGEIEVNLFSDDYKNFFKQLDFYNLKDGNSRVNKDYVLKKKVVTGTKSEDVYETVCSESGKLVNGTQKFSCLPQKTGTKEVKVYHWEEISSLDLIKGNTTIGIFMDVNLGDKIEWIPTLFGVEIKEWTTFVGADLIAYWHPAVTSSSNVQIGQYNAASFSLNTSQSTWYVVGGAVRAYKVDAPEFNINFSLWNTSSDVPNSPLGWNISMNISEISSTSSPGEWYNFTLPNIEVTNGTRYALVEMSNATSASNNIQWVYEGYGSGIDVKRYIYATGSWQAAENKANGFEIWATTAAPPASGGFNVSTALNSPNNGYSETVSLSNATILFNVSGIISGVGNLTNTTFYLWNSSNGVFNRTTNLLTGNITNSTTFNITNIPVGSYSWNSLTCGVNTTLTVCSFNESNYSLSVVPFSVNGEYFSNGTYETEKETFYINISTVNNIFSTSINLNYDSTEYFVETNCVDGFCELNRSIDVSLITDSSSSQKKPFFWELTLFATDGTIYSFNTTMHNQTVNEIRLFQSNSTYPTTALNFTTWDELNRTYLSPMNFDATFQMWLGTGTVKKNQSFDISSSAVPVNISIYPGNQTYKIDSFIEYNAAGVHNGTYTTRNYHFQNATISNDTQGIRLFLLKDSISTSFIQKVVDLSQLPVSNALIITQRYYPEDNTYETVSITKTNDDGASVGVYQTEVSDYRHFITKNGQLLKTTERGKIFPETTPYTLLFIIGENFTTAWQAFQGIDNIVSSLEFDNETKVVTYTWVDTTGALSIANLTVEKVLGNQSNIAICRESSQLTAGTLTCNVTGQNGTLIAKGYIGRSPSVLDKLITFTISTIKDILATPFLFMWIILLIAAMGAGMFFPPAGIVLTGIVVLLGVMLGIVGVSMVFVWAFVAVGIWIIIETAR